MLSMTRRGKLFGVMALAMAFGASSAAVAGDWWPWRSSRGGCSGYSRGTVTVRYYSYPEAERRVASAPAEAPTPAPAPAPAPALTEQKREERRSDQRAEKDIVETAAAAGSFKTLVAAVKAAGLVDTLKGKGPFTVFAPTDEAFARLPEGTVEMLLKPENKQKLATILTYHVVSGKVMAKEVVGLDSANTVAGPAVNISTEDNSVMIDNAKVIKTDIGCSNGVIHVIDRVIMPPDIVEIAESAGSFKTLVAALDAAELVETLKGKGPFTVFAPTDEAFSKLQEGTVKDLLKPENKEKLQSILTYHVVPGKVMAADVMKMKSAKTVQGKSLTIETDGGAVMVDGAKVIRTDIVGTNGVIHVIDQVVLPKE